MYTEIIGDLVNEAGRYDVVLHGCNCQNIMGSGVARYLRSKYPKIYDADTEAFRNGKVALGNYSKWYNEDINTVFINAYTQFNMRGRYKGVPDVDYTAIEKVLKKINLEYKGLTIGMPLIGCGLAGGNWKIVKNTIQNTLVDVNANIVFLLVEYLKIKIVEFLETYNIDLYDNWNKITINKNTIENSYILNLNDLLNNYEIDYDNDNFMNSFINNLSLLKCVKNVTKNGNIVEIDIANEYLKYY